MIVVIELGEYDRRQALMGTSRRLPGIRDDVRWEYYEFLLG